MGSTRLRVVANLLFLFPGRNRGTLTYVQGLLDQWDRAGYDIVLVLHREIEPLFCHLRFKRVRIPLAGSSRVARVFAEQVFLAPLAKILRADVLFCPGYTSPVVTFLPTVVSIHDMQFRDIRSSVPRATVWLNEAIIPLAAKSARAIITISQYSKSRILLHLKVPAARVFVTHLAGMEPSAGSCYPKAEFKYRFLSDKNYFIAVSTGAPYKNVGKVIEAFASYRKKGGAWSLVLVGQHTDWYGGGQSHCLPPEVYHLGFVERAELIELYRSAKGFVLASSYEGFGLPVLEAQSLAVPVISSDRASLPEVLSDSALYINPDSEDSIVDAFFKFERDSGLRSKLADAGFSNIKRFSWKKCAAETMDVLEHVSRRQCR